VRARAHTHTHISIYTQPGAAVVICSFASEASAGPIAVESDGMNNDRFLDEELSLSIFDIILHLQKYKKPLLDSSFYK